MELVLTGRQFTAQEAERWGVVSRVVGEGEGEVVKEAVALAQSIAEKSQVAVQAAKEAVNAGKPEAHSPIARYSYGCSSRTRSRRRPED